MNHEQLMGLLRDLGKFVAPLLAAKGILDEQTWLAIFGGVSMIGLSVWTWYLNNTAKMISTVAASPDVEKVVTTPEIAKADPSPKVVAG